MELVLKENGKELSINCDQFFLVTINPGDNSKGQYELRHNLSPIDISSLCTSMFSKFTILPHIQETIGEIAGSVITKTVGTDNSKSENNVPPGQECPAEPPT